jgi:hypothetical protein
MALEDGFKVLHIRSLRSPKNIIEGFQSLDYCSALSGQM